MNKQFLSSVAATSVKTLAASISMAALLAINNASASNPGSDNACSSLYNGSWTNGANGGTSFGAWQLSSGANQGFYVGNSDNNGGGGGPGINCTNSSSGIQAWGIWANSGATAQAIRPFTGGMISGEVFDIDFDTGYLNSSGGNNASQGFGLQDSSSVNRFELYFTAGASDYYIHDARGYGQDTGLGWTDGGLSVAFTLTGSNTYSVTIKRLVNGVSTNISGTLTGTVNNAISQVRCFHYNPAGGGGSTDFFVNYMSLSCNNNPPCAITQTAGSNCTGTQNTYSGPAGMTSYSWSLSATNTGATIVAPTTNQTVSVNNGSSSGTYTVNLLITNNGCSTTCSNIVTVNSSPTCSISPSSATICSNSTQNFTANPSGGTSPYTYSWSGPGAFTSTNATISVGTAGTYTCTVQDSKGCTTQCSVTLTVNANPSCSVSGANPVCVTSTNSYTGPNGVTYSWSLASGGGASASILGSSSSQSVSVSAGASSGTYTLTLTTTTNGCSTVCSNTVTVSTAAPCSITGASAVCANSVSNSYTAPSGAGLTYAWGISGNGTFTGSTNAQSVYVNATSSGTFTLTLTVGGINGCSNSVCNQTITVNPLPSCSISGLSYACPSSSSNSYSGPAGLSTYSWTLTGNGGTLTGSTTQQTVYVNGGASNSFTVSLSITDSNGCSSSCSQAVTVATSAPSISQQPTNTAVCTGNTGTLSVTASDIAGLNYTWKKFGWGLNGWQLNNQGTIGGFFTGSSTNNGRGGIDTACGAGCERSWGMWAASHNFTEALRLFNGSMAIGQTFTIQMNNGYLPNGAAQSVGFGLQNPGGQNRFEFFFKSGNTDYSITDTNGQGGTDSGIGWTLQGMQIAFTLTGTNTYSVTISPVTPGAFTSSTVTGYLASTTGTVIDRVRLFDFNPGSSDATQDTYFNNMSVGGKTDNASDHAYDGGWNYQTDGGLATLTNGPSGNLSTIAGATSGSLAVSNAQPNDGGTYQVTVSDNCGRSVTSTNAVLTVNVTPSAVIGAPLSVCGGSTGNTAWVPLASPAATYSWSITNGTITSSTTTNLITFTAGASGTVTLSVTVTGSGGCSSSGSANVTANASPATPTITVPTSACGNSTTNTASVPAITGGQYTWTINDGTITAGQDTPTITFVAGPSGTVTLNVTVTQPSDAGVSVLTQGNNTMRHGANLNEFFLNTSNVNTNTFGKLFSRAVDGQIYAQPLFVHAVSFSNGTHDAVYVCTENNSVYAFDGTGAIPTPLWQVNLGPAVPVTDILDEQGDVCVSGIEPVIGITGTPVIDPASGTLYVSAKTKESGLWYNRLHALDIKTGAEKFGGPVLVTATLSGAGIDSSGGTFTFNALHEGNRPGLLLMNGVVYIAYGSHCDWDPFHGWLFGYNATNLAQVAVYCTSPDGNDGSIWQSGKGLAADAAGNIYACTGNGDFTKATGGTDMGESWLKFNTTYGQIALSDWFTTFNQNYYNYNDFDVGTDGPLVLPTTNMIVSVIKTGFMYLLNQNHLGGYNAGGDYAAVEIISNAIAATDPVGPGPLYWCGPTNQFIYMWSGNDVLRQWQFNGSSILTNNEISGVVTQFDAETGGISISAIGNKPGSGILWGIWGLTNYPNGTLYAYNAENISQELWDSSQLPGDFLGNMNKFTSPTIANGRVYVATTVSNLVVYGLRTPPGCSSSSSTNIPVTTAPTCSPITGQSINCINTTNSYSGPTGAGYSYNWTLSGNSSGAAIVSGGSSNVVTVASGSSSGGYTLTYTTTYSGCGSSCTFPVTVYTILPAAISGSGSMCSGSSGTYTGPSGAGLTYLWSISGNGTLTAPTNTQSVTANATSAGSFTLSLTVSGITGCSSSTSNLTVTVNALPSCLITGPNQVYPNSVSNSYSGPSGLSTYSWGISGNGTLDDGGNNQTTYVNWDNSGTFTLSLSVTDSNGCASTCSLTVTNIALLQWPGYNTGYASDPASRIYHWAEEAVIGNGFISAMLDMNGSLYDIYFPSVGIRNGNDTACEGYRGPEENPYCPGLDQEANGQMNVINAMAGIAIPGGGTNAMYWMKNTNGTDYVNVSQAYEKDNNVVISSNKLTAAGQNIQVVQYDFCPATNALPIVTDGTRTNFGVYVKRYILNNQSGSPQTIYFYYNANFNVKGCNAYNSMYYDTYNNENAMVVYDNTDRSVTGNNCDPNGYGGTAATELQPTANSSYDKFMSVYFGTAMKLVTNSASGYGSAADDSWRTSTSTDNQEGWIGKSITLPTNTPVEVDVMVVGSWDDFAGATGTHNYWGRPMLDWFYTNSMATAQGNTETYWSNWLSGGVTAHFPVDAYNTVFKRALLVTALHCDAVTGAIIAGMHNGGYPYSWPRDGEYAAITLDKTGHTKEAANFYHFLRDVAYRVSTNCNPGGKEFFYQKYMTDGNKAWTGPQMDETAGVPWTLYYHYLTTGDGSFVSNYYGLAESAAYASYWSSCIDNRAYWDFANNLMHGNNIWEDQWDDFLYSNAAIVRGLRDAANLALVVGSNTEFTIWTNQAATIVGGLTNRVNARVEPSDISQLGMCVPFEVFTPTSSQMQAVAQWLHGNGAAAGGYNDDLQVESTDSDGDAIGNTGGYWRRYKHTITGGTDTYWNGGPWFLCTSWYGEFNARWQDFVGGKGLIDVNLTSLSNLVSRLGFCGLAAEQISGSGQQKYPNFWLQAAWPNVWESESTLVDEMMMFLDYKPEGTNNNTCYFAPKLPDGWSSMGFSNMFSQGQYYDIAISEVGSSTRADINKKTSGSLNYDLWLRIPTNTTPSSVVTNGVSYTPSGGDYDTSTGRVHIQGALGSSAGTNYIIVNY